MTFTSTPQMRVLAAAFRANVPILLWGSPGVGKTATVDALLDEWVEWHDTIIGGNRDAQDFLGLPYVDEVGGGGVKNHPPQYGLLANKHKTAALFFDELTTAPPSVQAAMLRVFQERVLGELQLGDHVRLIAAANPVDEAANGWDLSAPAANRMLHLDWKFDAEAWLMGVGSGFQNTPTYSVNELIGAYDDMNRTIAYSQVVGFLQVRGSEYLNPPVPSDPAEAGRAWPSPRAWSNVIDVLAQFSPRDDDAVMLVVKGLVGEAAAREFFDWRSLASLPNPDEVLADPENAVDWGARPDILFAIARAVTYLVTSRGTAEAYESGFKVMEAYGTHNKSDIALPSLKELIVTLPRTAKVPKEVQSKYSHLFEKAGVLKAA